MSGLRSDIPTASERISISTCEAATEINVNAVNCISVLKGHVSLLLCVCVCVCMFCDSFLCSISFPSGSLY